MLYHRLSASSIQLLDDLGVRNATVASSASVIVPAHSEIIHPPNLFLTCDSDVDSNGTHILEASIKSNRNQRTPRKTRTSWSRDELSVHLNRAWSYRVLCDGSDLPITIWTSRITTQRCSVNIEVIALINLVVPSSDFTSVAVIPVRENGAVECEVLQKLEEKWL